MRDSSVTDFGLVIAYLLPGGIGLWGIGQISPDFHTWLGTAALTLVTVGGFLTATLFALALGLLASTVRWLIIDPLHHRTGIKQPQWDFAYLAEREMAYELLVEIHYRYYQFYANSTVSLLFAFGAWAAHDPHELSVLPAGAVTLAITGLFFTASRDTLRKYYGRAGALLEADRLKKSSH